MALRDRAFSPELLVRRSRPMSDAVLQVQLQHTPVADAPAQIAARFVGKAIQLPVYFALKYDPNELLAGRSYSLRSTIKNKNDELLYLNDVHHGVKTVAQRNIFGENHGRPQFSHYHRVQPRYEPPWSEKDALLQDQTAI
jgi:Type III secretion system lipoprotein chaperone (YscW)